MNRKAETINTAGPLRKCLSVYFLTVAISFFNSDSFANNYYAHTVLAQTGQAGLTGIKSAPSINDLGQVAFIGQISGGEGVFYADSQTLANLSQSYASRTFSTTVQINNSRNIVARDSGGGAFFVRLWRPAS